MEYHDADRDIDTHTKEDNELVDVTDLEEDYKIK